MHEFQLLLFSTDTQMIRQAHAAGVAGIIVDWENIGKRQRQEGADTEINDHNLDDLRRVRRAMEGLVICRINQFGPWTKREVNAAISAGADEILLPMVRSAQEVITLLELVADRCAVGVLIETVDGVNAVQAISRLPLKRMYVGLNDLAIDRGSTDIFDALVDGTVEHVTRNSIPCRGFGGLTVPERGSPIPCRLLISEMVRLNCRFSFLRRSFHRDTKAMAIKTAVSDILSAIHATRLECLTTLADNRQTLSQLVASGNGVAPGLLKNES